MESFINFLNSLGGRIPFHTETLLAYLDESLADFNIKTSKLRVVRTGRHLMATIDDKYILRIRLFPCPKDEQEKRNRNVVQIVQDNKDGHLKEIEITQNIFKMFEECYTGTNPIPELVHAGKMPAESYSDPSINYGDNIVSIYKNIKGNLLDVSSGNTVKTARNLAGVMSTLHGYNKPYSGNGNVDLQYYKFLVSKKEELDKYPCRHVIVKDMLDQFISNHFQRFNRGTNTIELLNHGGLGTPHHILVDENEITGLVDWEHCRFRLSGFKEFENFYSQFIIEERNLEHVVSRSGGSFEEVSNDNYDKSIVFWDNLIQNYICPVKKRFLEKYEIEYIEFTGFLSNYCRRLELFNSGRMRKYRYKEDLHDLSMNLMVYRLSNRVFG